MALAAYASVLSLMQVLDNLRLHPLRHQLHLPIMKQLETLRQKFSFLQEFLETQPPKKMKELEDMLRQITDVADGAEDVIDIHVIDLLRGGSEDALDILRSFSQEMEKVFEKVDSIEKLLTMIIVEEMVLAVVIDEEKVVVIRERRPEVSEGLASSSGKNTVVGFDEHLVRIMEELTGYNQSLEIIPIVGMGGIGKTTLARNAFDNKYIIEHFDKCIWLTISQEYSVLEILCGLISDRKSKENNEDISTLGERLYKSLFGKRYLIVMDDVWSTEAWDDLKLYFPENKN